MKKLIDLHVHSTASDGILSPKDLVRKAKEASLSAISLCDHDTVNGLKEAMSSGAKMNIEIVPGVEITSYWKEKDRKEFHILGYYMDLVSDNLISTLKYYQGVRGKRAKEIVARLKNCGFKITYERVRKLARGAIGRPHLARAVIENLDNREYLNQIFGKTPNIGEIIESYIIPGKPAYVEKAGMEPRETIEFIHKNKGLAVLAHPGWDIKIGDEDTIKQFVEWKIDGIEAIHSKRTKEESLECINYFLPLARKYDLLVTGGSDFHAEKKEEPGADIGLLSWGISIPYELLEKLKKQHRQNFL